MKYERALVPPMYEATVTDWIRFHMMRAGGLSRDEAGLERDVSRFATLEEIDEAVEAKHSPDFERARDARYRMGHLRYGVLGWGQTRAYIESAIKRLQVYLAEGNREHLVDAVNLIELVWIHPDREGTYFETRDTDDDRSKEFRKGCL